MPRGSMLKYFRERGGNDHGGALFWPGTLDGFPFRGQAAPHLRQEEIAQVALALDFKSQMFCLWDQAQKAMFDEIMDRIVNGWYMQHRREDIYEADHNHYRVWLEWIQIYGETPAGKHPMLRSAEDGNYNAVTTVQPGRPALGQHDELPRLAL